ncbi:hypothetical protein Bca4012_096907 [Brassica carinata]
MVHKWQFVAPKTDPGLFMRVLLQPGTRNKMQTVREVLLERNLETASYGKRKLDFVEKEITKEGLDYLMKKMIEVGKIGLVFNPYGGKVSEVATTKTPFPHRKKLYKVQHSMNWKDPGTEAETTTPPDATIYQNFLQCFTTQTRALSNTLADVVFPQTAAGYTPALRNYIRNTRFNTTASPKPAIVIVARSEAHVQAAVVCTKTLKYQLKTRSGGHDYEGVSYTSNLPFFFLDMSSFHDITIEGETAWIGAGVTLGEVYYRIWGKNQNARLPRGVQKNLDENAVEMVHKWQFVAPKTDPGLFMRVLLQPGTRNKMQTIREVLLERNLDTASYGKRKLDFVEKEITKEGLDYLMKKMIEVGKIGLVFNPYGGKVSEVATTKTPFPHRKKLYKVQHSMNWKDPGTEAETSFLEKAKSFYSYMAPFGVEGLELNGSDAAIRKSRCGLIYVNEEDEEKALTFDGSDMGGRILRVTAYPFDSNRLDHFFATPEAQDKYRQRVLNVTGFDTSLAEDEVEEMARSVFPGSYCSVLGEVVFVHLRGKDAIEKALKLSGRSAGGFNLVVNAVLPLRQDCGGGISLARMLAMAKKDEAGRLAEAARSAKLKRTKAARLAKAETAKAARLALAEKDKAILSEGNQKSIMTTD